MSDLISASRLVKADSQGVQATITQSSDGLAQMGQSARQEAAFADRLTASLGRALYLPLNSAADYLAKYKVNAADDYTRLTSQLKVATGTQREFATAMTDVAAIANRYQADLNGIGAAYNPRLRRMLPMAAPMRMTAPGCSAGAQATASGPNSMMMVEPMLKRPISAPCSSLTAPCA